jgi:hypothetical protein
MRVLSRLRACVVLPALRMYYLVIHDMCSRRQSSISTTTIRLVDPHHVLHSSVFVCTCAPIFYIYVQSLLCMHVKRSAQLCDVAKQQREEEEEECNAAMQRSDTQAHACTHAHTHVRTHAHTHAAAGGGREGAARRSCCSAMLHIARSFLTRFAHSLFALLSSLAALPPSLSPL